MAKRGKKTATYTPAPEIDPDLVPRIQAVVKVLADEWTVTEAAKHCGISRLRFQTIYHRSVGAMVGELRQKPAGRPARPETEREMAEENARLRKENAHLSDRVGTIDRLLGVASDMLKGRITTSGRPVKTKSSSSSTSTSGTPPATEGASEPEDPDGAARRKLQAAQEMRRLGLRPILAAAVIGMSEQTVRRWAAAERSGEPLCLRPGHDRAGPPDPASAALAEEALRSLCGMIGADSLRIASGLSRRQAAVVKADVLTAMERERKAAAGCVEVTAPGIVRGFDQLYAWTTKGWRFALISGDAHVPYRTGALAVENYDEEGVLRAIAADIDRHGAPLVWRMDRASCHRTPAVSAYLDARGALVLHGPPHHPQYYGQTERQNLEHRAWLRAQGTLAVAGLQATFDRMLDALNTKWPRRALGWRTPADVWSTRAPIPNDLRARFRHEVYDRVTRLEEKIGDRDLAMRLAIEKALNDHGYLRVQRQSDAN